MSYLIDTDDLEQQKFVFETSTLIEFSLGLGNSGQQIICIKQSQVPGLDDMMWWELSRDWLGLDLK